MAKFTAEVSQPQAFQDYRRPSESPAEAIGAGLGGLAQILDVGLKASAESRKDDVLAGVEDSLTSELKAFNQPKLVGETTPQSPETAAAQGTEAYSQVDQKANIYRQAYNQGRMSRQEFLARTANVTQQAIHENPRFADEIRKRAQAVLGINPTEAAVALEFEGQKAEEDAKRQMELASAKVAADAGFSGTLPQLVDIGRELGNMKYNTERLTSRLQQRAAEVALADAEHKAKMQPVTDEQAFATLEHTRAETARLLNPTITPTAEDKKQARQAGIQGLVQPLFDQVHNGAINNLLEMQKHPEQFQELSKLSGPDQQIWIQNQLTKIHSGLMDQVNAKVLSNPNITEEDAKDVRAKLEAQFSAVTGLFTGNIEDAAATARIAKGISDNFDIGLSQSAPMIFQTRNLGPVGALAIQSSMYADTAVRQELIRQGSGLLQQSFGSSRTPTPADIHQDVLDAAHGALDFNTDIANPNQKAAVMMALEPVLNGWGKGKLEPAFADKYANSALQYTKTGLAQEDPRDLARTSYQMGSISQLQLIDQLSGIPEEADKAKALGTSVYALSTKSITSNARTLRPETSSPAGGLPVGITAYYNPNTGQVEISKELINNTSIIGGKVVHPQTTAGKVSPELQKKVDVINRNLRAVEYLHKDYGSDADKQLNDRQLKQFLIEGAGIPLKPGVPRVEMPGDKKEGTIKGRVKQNPQ